MKIRVGAVLLLSAYTTSVVRATTMSGAPALKNVLAAQGKLTTVGSRLGISRKNEATFASLSFTYPNHVL